jgi:hypothetical protein
MRCRRLATASHVAQLIVLLIQYGAASEAVHGMD